MFKRLTITENVYNYKAAVSLRGYRAGTRVPFLYTKFGSRSYNSVLAIPKFPILLSSCTIDTDAVFVNVYNDDGSHMDLLSYKNSQEFFKYWNIIDRRLLIEKTGYL